MKEVIKIKKLLREYLKWVEAGEIEFLKGKNNLGHKGKVKSLVKDLVKEIPNNNAKTKLNWYNAHKIGRKLWEELASAALNNIDKDSKGNKRLFEYLDKATAFEDILYGLEEHYRDHTLHSLWVYFIGEEILRSRELRPLQRGLNWYLFNDIETYKDVYSYPPDLVTFSIFKKKELEEKVNKYKDAVWCIMALCHDLGYSLAKLTKLNEKVKDVVGFLDIPDIRDAGYFLDVEHQHLAAQFLELMAMDVRIVPSEDYERLVDIAEELELKPLNVGSKKESEQEQYLDIKSKSRALKQYKQEIEERTLIKCYRDDAAYWRVCRALEKKQHGILGAYLIYKMLGIFADTSVRGPAEEWGLEDDEVVANIIRGDILYAIALHEFDFAHLHDLSSLADILVLADELEEFSRYGRQLLSRKYHETMAEASISFEVSPPEEGQKEETVIEINIEYKVAEDHDMGEFFQRKAKNLCQFYSLGPEEKDRDPKQYRPKYFEIQGINITVEQSKNALSLTFNLRQDSNHRFKVQQSERKAFERNLECQDDTLRTKDVEHILLKDLFENWGEYNSEDRLIKWRKQQKTKGTN